MSQNSQFNRYDLPIYLRRKLFSSRATQSAGGAPAEQFHVIELVAGEPIVAGDIIGILDKTNIGAGHALADYTAFKQDAGRSILHDKVSEYDYSTVGIATNSAAQGETVQVQTAFEFDYSKIRTNEDGTDRYIFKIGRRVFVTSGNEIVQLCDSVASKKFMKSHKKLCCFGVATSATRVKIECFDNYIMAE